MEFNPLDYCDIETVDGVQNVTIDPAIMYPAVIARIRYCLDEKVFPAELIQSRMDEDGKPVVLTDRAATLFANARLLADVSSSAWDDALEHRENFFAGRVYAPPGKRSLDLYADNLKADIQQLWYRGDALEIALGWFLQALRCKIGGSNNTILTGVNPDASKQPQFYHYQL
jgi:hypothetical protein